MKRRKGRLKTLALEVNTRRSVPVTLLRCNMYPVHPPPHRMNSRAQYSRLIARNNAETNAALPETTVAKNLRNFWRMAPHNRSRTNFMYLGYGLSSSFTQTHAYLFTIVCNKCGKRERSTSFVALHSAILDCVKIKMLMTLNHRLTTPFA